MFADLFHFLASLIVNASAAEFDMESALSAANLVEVPA
jgi:hypothetical protein